VKVECCDLQHPIVQGLGHDDRDARWWMETGSYPCEVLDPAVRVLVRSEEVGERFGASAVVVEWDEGEGRVLHLVSHLYLQRADCRTLRDAESGTAFYKTLGLSEERARELSSRSADASAADLKAGYAMSSLVLEAIVEQKKRAGRSS
jgi:hypothetical protein